MGKILSILMLIFSISTFGVTTWNGASWSNGIPAFNDDAIINGNYTVGISNGANNLICKSLTINVNATFIIKTGFYVNVGENSSGGDLINNGLVIVQSGADFWIFNGKLKNNSSENNFIIENGGGMIQFNNSILNDGKITIKRNTKPVKLNDYTYWSSPVENQRYDQLPPNPAPIAGLRVFGYDNLVSSYYGWNTEYARNSNGTMIKGKGYIAHKYLITDTNPQVVHTMNFVGVPNNGNISINLTSFIGNRPNVGYLDGSMYLTGNPYPSSLNMRRFLIINNASAIYLWTHNTVLSSSISGSELYNYTNDDYATYNLTGGVAASSPINDGTPNNTNIPTRYIGSGQGFFVKAPQLGSKTFNFNNSMRGYLPNSTNTQFFRDSKDIDDIDEENRIWLFLTNNFNITRYNLIGYVSGSSNEFDHQYDAVMIEGRQAAIYSVLNDKNLTIEGRALPFDSNDEIKLGYMLPKEGVYQIGINDVDGLFSDSSQPIFLYDNLLGVTHNLKNGNYSFTVNGPEKDDNRFILKFKDNSLANQELTISNTVLYNQNNNVIIKTNENIKNIIVYNILGKEINKFENVNNNSLIMTNLPQGVLIFKINVNGVTVTKKHIKN